MIVRLKTFFAYLVFYTMVSAGWMLALEPYFGEVGTGVGTLVAFIGTLCLYFGRRIPRWKKERHTLSR